MARINPVIERQTRYRRPAPLQMPGSAGLPACPSQDAFPAAEESESEPGLGAYLAAVWRCRHFWLSLVQMDFLARYRRSMFGLSWSLLHPLATALVMCFVFQRLFALDLCHFIPFLLAGLAFWAYLVGATLQGCQCFVDSESYIRQHPLPLAVYPLRTTLRTLIDLLIALAIVILVTAWLRGFTNPLALVYLLAGVVLLFLFGWSLATLAGYIHTIFRDTRHIAEIGFQGLFYLTPIAYPPELLTNTHMAWLVRFNPLMPFVNMIRLPLLECTVPTWRTLAAAAGVTLVVTATAVALWRHLQRRVILYL
jgi:lipopolysaccharide transport system permease protein